MLLSNGPPCQKLIWQCSPGFTTHPPSDVPTASSLATCGTVAKLIFPLSNVISFEPFSTWSQTIWTTSPVREQTTKRWFWIHSHRHRRQFFLALQAHETTSPRWRTVILSLVRRPKGYPPTTTQPQIKSISFLHSKLPWWYWVFGNGIRKLEYQWGFRETGGRNWAKEMCFLKNIRFLWITFSNRRSKRGFR